MVFQKIVQYADKQRICINTQIQKPIYTIKIKRMSTHKQYAHKYSFLGNVFSGPGLGIYPIDLKAYLFLCYQYRSSQVYTLIVKSNLPTVKLLIQLFSTYR